jgi:hypothetical protein
VLCLEHTSIRVQNPDGVRWAIPEQSWRFLGPRSLFFVCVLSPVVNLSPKFKPRFNPNAERAFLAGLPFNEARQVAGSINKRGRILAGKTSIEEVYNGGKDELYKWRRVGDVASTRLPAQTTAMPKVHPDVLRSGDSRLQASQALVKTHSNPQWGQKHLTRHKKQTSKLVAKLVLYQNEPEVDDFLRRLVKVPDQVDSRELHYIQRRYIDGRSFNSMDDIDALYQRIIEDPDALVYQAGGMRYQVRSIREGWIAIVEPGGARVSLYPDLNDNLGKPLCLIKELIIF